MNKQFTDNAKKGIQGEVFFEFIITKYAIPHKIDRSKDLGMIFYVSGLMIINPRALFFLLK